MLPPKVLTCQIAKVKFNQIDIAIAKSITKYI